MPHHGDVDVSVMSSIMPPLARKKFAQMEREDTAIYYRQAGHKVSKKCVSSLYGLFESSLKVCHSNLENIPKVQQKPNDWWKGLIREALGPLASHPQAERLIGRSGPEKLNNVLNSVTHKVGDAREKLLKLDNETLLGTVTGNLETPSPLAGLISPLSRHLIALCHSHIVEWLCALKHTSSSGWNNSIVNALYTFELFFLDYQFLLWETYKV